MKIFNRNDIHRGDADAYRARIVPNNSFAFPPVASDIPVSRDTCRSYTSSLEVSVGDTIPGKESVESSREQRPRAMHGAIADAQRKLFIVGVTINVGVNPFAFGITSEDGHANEFAPTRNICNSKKLCVSARPAWMH